MRVDDINALESESGVIATLIHHPEYAFFSENLLPEYFTNKENRSLYRALCELARRSVKSQDVDAYLISETITSNKDDEITIDSLKDLIEISDVIARDTVEAYKLLVSNVVEASLRRDLYKKLRECMRICANQRETDIENRIITAIDEVVMSYSSMDELPEFGDIIDNLWAEIEEERGGSPFIFPSLNKYVRVEKKELVVFGGGPKSGKSMLMLNQAIDLLKQGKSVLYIDSELSDKMFLRRLVSRLSHIEFSKIRDNDYNDEEREKIHKALQWFKQFPFVHVYMPVFTKQAIYTAVKQIVHRFGSLDVLMVDYLKYTGTNNDSYSVYNELGALTDLIKNEICGKMEIAGIAAAQLNKQGSIADSEKITKNASTVVYLTPKTPDEMQMDGEKSGTRKLTVAFNRNGPQHVDGEWINVYFWGDYCYMMESKIEHVLEEPF